MNMNRYTVSTLLRVTAVAAVVSLALMRIADERSVIDFTRERSNVCELHGIAMKKQLVGMIHGKRPYELDSDPESNARRTKFPHADEPYCTGFCIPTAQAKARVYICPKCTDARITWVDTLAQELNRPGIGCGLIADEP